MKQALKIAVCLSIAAAFLVIYQWRSHIASYHERIDVFEVVEISLVAVDMNRVYERTSGLGLEVIPGRRLNEEQVIGLWLEQSDRYAFESFFVLKFDNEGKMVDSQGRLLRIYYLGDGTEEISDKCLDRLRHRFRFAVWSVGSNGVDECGRGDDLFHGVDHKGELWRDPSIWERFKRRGRLLE